MPEDLSDDSGHVLLPVKCSSISGKLGKLGRAAQVVGINLVTAIALSITFGYPADMFLALGRHFERGARTPEALWCYERGLNKEPADWIASYLQYRVALLHHKLGNPDKANAGLGRIGRYTIVSNI